MAAYFKRFKLHLIIVIILLFFGAVCNILLPVLFNIIYDRIAGKNDYSYPALFGMVAIYAVLSFWIIYIQQKESAKLSANIVKAIRTDVIESILFYKSKTFGNKNMTVVSMLNTELRQIQEDYISRIFSVIKLGITFLLAFIYLVKINVYLSIVVIALGWSSIVLPKLFEKNNQKYKDEVMKNTGSLMEALKEMLYGFEVIKSFRIEKRTFKMLNEESNRLENANAKSKIYGYLIEGASDLVGIFVFCLNVIIAGFFATLGLITIGAVVATTQLMTNVNSALYYVPQYVAQIRSVEPIIKRILGMIEQRQPYTGKELTQPIDKICFSNVSFAYDETRDVINNFSFDFEAGKKYAIVGASGSGKSTLLGIIAKRLEEYTGQVSVNHDEITDISYLEWMNRVSVISQSVFLFNDTIYENICLGNEFTKDEIDKVVIDSGLADFVKSLPNGINENVGENGANISGGEKQRISIARALLRKSDILLIDEVTSSLDNLTASKIEETIMNINKTIIMVTHRYSENMFKNLDGIIVLSEGKIVEYGKYQDLIKNNGVFYKLSLS